MQVRIREVHDGDTVTGFDDAGRRLTIRLASIDAPELAQPFGTAARDALESLIVGQAVDLVGRGRDRYGRTLGNLFLRGQLVNLELVVAGWAWQFRRYDRSDAFALAQLDAAEAGRGLWARGTGVLPPWEFRAAKQKVESRK